MDWDMFWKEIVDKEEELNDDKKQRTFIICHTF